MTDGIRCVLSVALFAFVNFPIRIVHAQTMSLNLDSFSALAPPACRAHAHFAGVIYLRAWPDTACGH